MGQPVRERKGTLGGQDIFLSRTAKQPYALTYREIQPDRVDIPGASGKIEGDPSIRSWIMTDWSGGSGEPIWKETLQSFNSSAGLRPYRRDQGLALGPGITTPDLQGGGAMTAAGVFTFNTKVPITADDANEDGKIWDDTNNEWDPKTNLTGTGTGRFTSAAAIGTVVWLSTNAEQIIKWTPGVSSSVHYATAAGDPFGDAGPILAAFNGILYAVDDGDLYVIDQSTTDTRTKVSDTLGSSQGLNDSFNRRLTVTDSGLQWFHIDPSTGYVNVHDYNHFTDTHSIVGRVPGTFPHVTDIHFAKGFMLALYQGDPDEWYLWFKSGGQEGVIGPMASPTVNDFSVIAGELGDELIMSLESRLWAYRFSTGGFYRLHNDDISTADQTTNPLFFGSKLFLSHSGDASLVDFDTFDTDSTNYSTLNTGRFDFDYPGFNKIFREVIIYTDTGDGDDGNLQLAYAVDGGTFTTHADTKTISAANRKHTFTLSSSAASVTGTELELQLRMKSDGTDAPIIRKVVARAVPSAKTVEYALELDVAGPHADGTQPSSTQMLSFLKTVATTGTVIAFVNPWEVEDHEDAETIDVEVVQVILPEAGAEAMEQGTAKIRLRATSTA